MREKLDEIEEWIDRCYMADPDRDLVEKLPHEIMEAIKALISQERSEAVRGFVMWLDDSIAFEYWYMPDMNSKLEEYLSNGSIKSIGKSK